MAKRQYLQYFFPLDRYLQLLIFLLYILPKNFSILLNDVIVHYLFLLLQLLPHDFPR